MEEYRKQNPSQSSVQKTRFPHLLNKLISNMEMKNTANLIAGFEACGIYPFNPQRVIKKFPQASSSTATEGSERSPFKISAALLEFLQQFKVQSARGFTESTWAQAQTCYRARQISLGSRLKQRISAQPAIRITMTCKVNKNC